MSDNIDEIKEETSFLDVIKDTVIHRLTTPFYFYIISSFIFSNWDKILYLIYGTESIETRTSIIQMEGINYFDPLWHGLVIAVIMPYFSRLLEIIHLSSDICQNWLSKKRNIAALRSEDHLESQRHTNILNNKKRSEAYEGLLTAIEQHNVNLDELKNQSKSAYNLYLQICKKHSSFLSLISGEVANVVNLRSVLYQNELTLDKIKNDLTVNLKRFNSPDNSISTANFKQYMLFDINMIDEHLELLKKIKSKNYFNHDENSTIDIEYDLNNILDELHQLTKKLDPDILHSTTV
ncbi:hypothetical protein [Citrobacter sp. wls619]|uniref:hypothetical protein n=1 Tax=Citrobacter sp. wls619 TaxID=2576432 RepID=UPI0020170FB4|nr:hypothetical protein [Citrobacter sp. wls619]